MAAEERVSASRLGLPRAEESPSAGQAGSGRMLPSLGRSCLPPYPLTPPSPPSRDS